MKHQIIFFLLLFVHLCKAQISMKGYLTEMPSVLYNNATEDVWMDNLVHNRLNFSWMPHENIDVALELRNRYMWGETIKAFPGYDKLIDHDAGWVDMSYNLSSGEDYVLNTFVDRFSFQYSKGKFQARVGRQRINWGMGMVWNPNDIFNSYSYFDFDYVERPGVDGVRLQYYTGYSSALEFAYKIDYLDRISSAVKYQFNKWGYDYQFLAAYYNDEDWVLGAGWSGDIKGAGFYGEVSYFYPKDENGYPQKALVGTLGANYTFKNSLMLQSEILYSSNIKNSFNSLAGFYLFDASVKRLSISDFTWFSSVSYPFTPLFNASFSYIV